MLYYIFKFFEDQYNLPGAGLFEYITFRAGGAIIVSLLISLILGNRIIRYLKSLQIGERVRDLGLEGQQEKAGTPTMGGIIIILSIVVPTVLFAKLDNVYVWIMLCVTLWMGIIGFVDDYIKVFRENKKGLKAKFKIVGQLALGGIIAGVMLKSDQVLVRMTASEARENAYEVVRQLPVSENGVQHVYVKSHQTNIPFFRSNNVDYRKMTAFLGDKDGKYVWLLFVPIVVFVVIAVSNAANLTDGLDGLATGVSAIIAGTLAILAYVSGNTIFAEYLGILYLPGSAELVIFSSGLLGACVGFLWYNAYPAKVFMGDTGSLTLGGIIAALAILLRKELLIPLLCGIFLIENLSVVMQVGYFKYTKKKYGAGKRIFKMAPLHHHYQKMGMHEAKIVTRFWIVGMMLAVLTIITLKIR